MTNDKKPVVVIKRFKAAVYWYGTVDGKLIGPKHYKHEIDELLNLEQWREVQRQLAARKKANDPT
jgi:hypothetical protein